MSAIYQTFARRMMAASQCTPTTAVDLAADTIHAVFVNVTGTGTTYTFSQTHEFFSQVTAGAMTGNTTTSPTFNGTGAGACPVVATPTFATPQAGVFDAADTVFSGPPDQGANDPFGEALILYKQGTAANNSPLIAYIDGFSNVDFNGGQVTVVWDSGANRIFKLVA